MIQIPHSWNPKARCPQVDDLFRLVLPPNTIPFFWEIIGSALVNVQTQRAPMLLGTGGNGKTAVVNAVVSMLGEESVSTVDFERLCTNRFGAVPTRGMLANVCDDIGSHVLDSE